MTRLARALAAAAAVFALGAAPAHATVLAGGEVDRGGAGPLSLDVVVNNGSDSGEAFQSLRLVIPGAGPLANVLVAGSSAACAPTDLDTLVCRLPPPSLSPGESFEVAFTTAQRVPDQVGATVFVGDVGPFRLVGPFPQTAPRIDGNAAIAAFRSKRRHAGDACTHARRLFQHALAAFCVGRGGRKVRGIVINSGDKPLALTISGAGWVRRLHVPANGGAGFTRKGGPRRRTTLVVVDAASGDKVAVRLRLPPRRRRG